MEERKEGVCAGGEACVSPVQSPVQSPIIGFRRSRKGAGKRSFECATTVAVLTHTAPAIATRLI